MAKRKKIVLIGAGSAVFTQGLIADFIMTDDLGQWEIALVDIDKKAIDSISLLAKKMIGKRQANIVISSSQDRRELLPGADVVVTTIAVGGRTAWKNDVDIPRTYGIYQPVGDTTGPGGISRALRMIPTMLEVARDVQELCPDAYFFNYSNPMTAICASIRQETDVSVTGLCHGVIHVEHFLADFIGADKEKARSLGVGLNHLTFLYDFRIEGENAWPQVDEKLERLRKNKTSLDDPFSWSVYERYGAFPAVMDRHIVEFFPERFPNGRYYGKVLGVDAFSIENVLAAGDRKYQEMHEQAAGTRELNEHLFARASGEHEQLVDILRSLYKDERRQFSVNLPNAGSVPNLPSHAILEMPAVATARGFHPLLINDFPELAASILRKRITVVDLTVEAALKGEKSLFVEALLADGAVTDEETAEKLAEDLLQEHRPYLPQFFK